MNIISFDLSTTVIGICVFDLETKNIKVLTYYKFTGDNLISKGTELNDILKKYIEEYSIKIFILEERLKSFRAGGTNADAMLKLACLNYLCQYLLNVIDKDIQIIEINVKTARKLAFAQFYKIERLIKIDDKQLAFNLVIKELDENLFPKKIMKSGPRKGQEVFIEEAQDMSDAYILIRAYLATRKHSNI